jgi:hypothetical protein
VPSNLHPEAAFPSALRRDRGRRRLQDDERQDRLDCEVINLGHSPISLRAGYSMQGYLVTLSKKDDRPHYSALGRPRVVTAHRPSLTPVRLVRLLVKGHQVRSWDFFCCKVPLCNEVLALHCQHCKIEDHVLAWVNTSNGISCLLKIR